jgi:hypothetical protein
VGRCNQDDVDEKNHRVQMMRKIYLNALMTFVWLGKAWDGLEAAIQAIKQLAVVESAERMAALSQNFGPFPTMAELTRAQHLPAQDSEELNQLGALLRNPWFTRAWTLQERLYFQRLRSWYVVR